MQALRAIDSPEMLRAVSDPHRLEILRRVMIRPETLSSLGVALDKHPAWIRHHVKALEGAGLVVLVEERHTRNYVEKFYGATAAAFTLSILIRPRTGEGGPIVALASHDFAFQLLTDVYAESGQKVAAGVAGSLDSLIAVRQGLADIAGCHLIDFETGQYNVPYVRRVFPDRDIVLITLAYREQGLIVAPGNPLGLSSFTDIAEKRGRFVNRNRGSGTRLVIDHAAAVSGLRPEDILGYDVEVSTHTEAASLVAGGAADVALGIEAAADRLELTFVPVLQERYDLVMTAELYDSGQAERLLDVLHRPEFRRHVAQLGGYDPVEMGGEYRLAV